MLSRVPNLLKTYNINAAATDARVINSNERMEARMRELALSLRLGDESQEESEDGFREGLAAEEIEPEPEPDPQELIEEARREAKQILDKARDSADFMMNDAYQKGQVLFEEKRNEGYSAGLQMMQEELAQHKAKMEEELEQHKAELTAAYRKREEELESDIIDALIQVFDKVFHIQFDDKKEILLYLVKNTLMNIDVGRSFRIRVAETNRHFLESHLDDIRERIGSDVSIEIVNDMNLNGRDCQIETDYGIFNCGIDMELSNLEKDIRSLCS